MGERLTLRDLQQAARLELDGISESRKAELIAQLEEARELRQTGSRANTVAAAQDAISTVVNFGVEVSIRVIHVLLISDLMSCSGSWRDSRHGLGCRASGFLWGDTCTTTSSPRSYSPMEAALFLRKSWALVVQTCWRSLNHGGGEGTRVSIKVNVLDLKVLNPYLQRPRSVRI